MTWVRSLPWLLLLACPSTYLLVASSRQFKVFSPDVVTSTHWYVTVFVSGFLVCFLVSRIREVVYAGVILLSANLAGYAVAYYVGLSLIGGGELARLGLSTLVQPLLLQCAVGGLLLVVGAVFGVVTRGMHLR